MEYHRYVLMVVLLLAYALVYFHRTMTGVMKPEVDVYSSYYGISSSLLLAVMSSAYFYAYGFSQLFMGPLVDYYGVKRACSSMLLLLSIATVVMSIPNPWTLIVGRSLVGFSASIAFLSYMRTSALYFGIGSQARLASYALVVGGISTILATYPLRMALDTFGIQPTFIALALFGIALAVSVYMLSIDVGMGSRSIADQAREIVRMAGDPHIWGVAIASIGSYGTVMAYQAGWGQVHMSEGFGMNYDEIGMHLMVLAIVFALSSFATGYLSDMVVRRRKPFIVLSPTLAVISWMIMYVATTCRDLVMLDVGLAVMGMSQGLQIVAPTMAKEPYNLQASGTAVALFNIVLFTGIAVAQTTCSMTSPLTAITISMVIAMIGTVASITLARETYSPKNGSQTFEYHGTREHIKSSPS